MNTTVIDAARATAGHERAFQSAGDACVQTEYSVIERMERGELWQLMINLTTSEAERVALRERFAFALPPRVIQARHPELFSDVTVVYAVVHNMRDRLRRYKRLAQLHTDYLAA